MPLATFVTVEKRQSPSTKRTNARIGRCVRCRPTCSDRALESRIERLKKVRDQYARELRIEGSILAPRHVPSAVASIEARDIRQLDAIPAMREWQKRVLGERSSKR